MAEGGSSLIHHPKIVDTIRQLYPGDTKNYTPKSNKVTKIIQLMPRNLSKMLRLFLSQRKSIYEVTLEELIKVYKEANLRDGLQVSTFSIGGMLSKPLLAY